MQGKCFRLDIDKAGMIIVVFYVSHDAYSHGECVETINDEINYAMKLIQF